MLSNKAVRRQFAANWNGPSLLFCSQFRRTIIMPYKTLSERPDSVPEYLPMHAEKIYLAAFIRGYRLNRVIYSGICS